MGGLYYRDHKTKRLYYTSEDGKWILSGASYYYHTPTDTPMSFKEARRKFPVAFPLKDKLPKHIEA
jgi:hypothetical protein